ncbi:hypothetical protein ACFT9I_14795 [Streptomyces sp. NPDC057137]|uniref:hypothetical protein n=1 Tax=Streptomyces sp. NPDC057137 TaxID=3346030 RepID=UPI0036361CF3
MAPSLALLRALCHAGQHPAGGRKPLRDLRRHTVGTTEGTATPEIGAQRAYEVNGCQAVEVGGYGFRRRGNDPLEVGDRVLLPENYVSRLKNGPGPTVGVVNKLGTTYRGPLSDIVGRAPATGGDD